MVGFLAGFGSFWLVLLVVLGRFGWFRFSNYGENSMHDCQRDSHATSQTVIYANITQTGRIRVYCSWFWVVLVGFVGGFGWFCWWFWVALAGSVF